MTTAGMTDHPGPLIASGSGAIVVVNPHLGLCSPAFVDDTPSNRALLMGALAGGAVPAQGTPRDRENLYLALRAGAQPTERAEFLNGRVLIEVEAPFVPAAQQQPLTAALTESTTGDLGASEVVVRLFDSDRDGQAALSSLEALIDCISALKGDAQISLEVEFHSSQLPHALARAATLSTTPWQVTFVPQFDLEQLNEQVPPLAELASRCQVRPLITLEAMGSRDSLRSSVEALFVASLQSAIEFRLGCTNAAFTLPISPGELADLVLELVEGLGANASHAEPWASVVRSAALGAPYASDAHHRASRVCLGADGSRWESRSHLQHNLPPLPDRSVKEFDYLPESSDSPPCRRGCRLLGLCSTYRTPQVDALHRGGLASLALDVARYECAVRSGAIAILLQGLLEQAALQRGQQARTTVSLHGSSVHIQKGARVIPSPQ